eukprot:jgi/Botrbrau1/22368/Bobra.0002s0045.1
MDMGRQPDDFSNLIRLGEDLRRLGDYKQSLEQLDKAVELKSFDVVALRQRGTTKRMMCKYFEALGDLDVAFWLDSNDILTLRCRADIETQLGNFDRALRDLAAAETIDTYDAAILVYRASTKWKMVEKIEALKDLVLTLDKLVQLKGKMQVHLPYDDRMQYYGGPPSLRRSNMDKNMGALWDLYGALSLELMVIKDKASRVCTLIQRAITNALMGRYEYALEDLGKGFSLASPTPGEPFLLFLRGVLKRNMEKHDEGLLDLSEALIAVPNNSLFLRHRGVILCLMGKYQEALQDLDMAAQNIAEIKPEYLCIRGETKSLMNNFEEALKDLDMADKMEPDNARILASRGAVKVRMGWKNLIPFKDALVDLNRAVRLEPNSQFAVMWRGIVKWSLKQKHDAWEDLDHALHMWGEDDRDVWALFCAIWLDLGDHDMACMCARRGLEALHRPPYLLAPTSPSFCQWLLQQCEASGKEST